MSLRLRPDVSVSLEIPAPPEAVWAVVGDVTRAGEWSGECRTVSYVDGAAAGRPGARFRGRNRRGTMMWSRTNELLGYDPPREIAWRTIPTIVLPDSTHWRITLEPVAAGTLVTESFRVTKPMPRPLELAAALTLPAHRDRTGDLLADLRRLGDLVVASRAGAATP